MDKPDELESPEPEGAEVVSKDTRDASQDMIGLEGCKSSHLMGYISSLGEAFHLLHLYGEEGEEEGDKIVRLVGPGIGCQSGVFEVGPLASCGPREILSGSNARYIVELEVV